MNARAPRALLICFMLSLVPVSAVPAPPVETPFFEEVQDINPCTGELITLTFTGVAVVHEA
jgi:hypothetical protein